MREGTLQMSHRDRRRVEKLGQVRDGLITVRAASEKMGLSYRQAHEGFGPTLACEKLNSKFAHPPMAEEDFHVALRPGQDLRDIFCFQTQRSMGRDWVVRDNNRFYPRQRDRRKMV